MPRTPGALNKKTLAKAASTPPPSKPKATPPATVEPVVSSTSSEAPAKKETLKDLASRVLADRQGDPSKARKVTAKPAAADPLKKSPAAKEARRTMEEADPEVADALAGVLADGEASLGAMFVPDDKAERVQSFGSRILKYAWKYHFIQNGVNGFPSWVVILVAHLGFGAALILPNKERLEDWWKGLSGKLEIKPTQHTPAKEAPSQHKAVYAAKGTTLVPTPAALAQPMPKSATTVPAHAPELVKISTADAEHVDGSFAGLRPAGPLEEGMV